MATGFGCDIVMARRCRGVGEVDCNQGELGHGYELWHLLTDVYGEVRWCRRVGEVDCN